MMQAINKHFKRLKAKHKYPSSIREQEQNRVKIAIKEINEMRTQFGKDVAAFVDFVYSHYPPKCH